MVYEVSKPDHVTEQIFIIHLLPTMLEALISLLSLGDGVIRALSTGELARC